MSMTRLWVAAQLSSKNGKSIRYAPSRFLNSREKIDLVNRYSEIYCLQFYQVRKIIAGSFSPIVSPYCQCCNV